MKHFIFSILLLTLLPTNILLAQSEDEMTDFLDTFSAQFEIDETLDESDLEAFFAEEDLKDEGFEIGGAVSCFDYYTFGGVAVSMTSSIDSYEPGEPVILIGTITNENRFPLTDLTIAGRIIKDTPNPVELRSEIITLDEVVIAENISIDALETKEISFTYTLPFNAPQGDYKVLFFAYNQNRFNQAGLFFTNDIIASDVSFAVSGENAEHTYLDQTRILLNDQEHDVMAFLTQHENTAPVKITIPLVNPTDTDATMTVHYSLYGWDSINPDNELTARTDQVEVKANDEVLLEYIVEDPNIPVYFLRISSEMLDTDVDSNIESTRTLSNIRFAVNGEGLARVNSVGITHYPLKKGEEVELFTCFHNGGDGNTEGTTLETILYNGDGEELSRTRYSGYFPGNITAIATSFIPEKTYTELSIVTRLLDAEQNELDSVTTIYSCSEINEAYCPQNRTLASVIVLGLILIFLLMGRVVYGALRKKYNSNTI